MYWAGIILNAHSSKVSKYKRSLILTNLLTKYIFPNKVKPVSKKDTLMLEKIAGVVVLYNPDEYIADNIKTYNKSVSKLYVVDNSEAPSEALKEKLLLSIENIEYIPLYQNLGIAKALNLAASKAADEGFEWLLTMDQDSQASIGMIQNLINSLKNENDKKVGIVAPRYVLKTETNEKIGQGLEQVYVAITSGSLLSLKAFQEIGPFREEFFIDYVDHEYCLRLRLNNYKTLIDNNILLYHQLGDSKTHSIFGHRINSSHHNFIRRYYITRNRLAVLDEYKKLYPFYYDCEKTNNIRELLKVLLFEKDKIKKMRSIFYGYLDYKRNKFGKYSH